MSFGRVSGLCQVLITVECWHEFSAALQSNKKSQEEQARALQPLSVAFILFSGPNTGHFPLPCCTPPCIWACPWQEIGQPIVPSCWDQQTVTDIHASPTSVTMCPKENTTTGKEQLINFKKKKSWVNYTINHRQRTSSQHHQKSSQNQGEVFLTTHLIVFTGSKWDFWHI